MPRHATGISRKRHAGTALWIPHRPHPLTADRWLLSTHDGPPRLFLALASPLAAEEGDHGLDQPLDLAHVLMEHEEDLFDRHGRPSLRDAGVVVRHQRD